MTGLFKVMFFKGRRPKYQGKDLGQLLYNSAKYGIITKPYSFDNMGGVVYQSMGTRDMTISDPKILKKKCERPMCEDSFLYN